MSLYSVIQEMVKNFCFRSSEREIRECSSKLEKLYSDHLDQKPEPLILRYYQVDGRGEIHPVSHHQYNFLKSLEVVLKNKPQISLQEALIFMEEVVSSRVEGYHSAFEVIFQSRSDIVVDAVVSFVREVKDSSNNLSTKLTSFLGSGIFKIILELNPDTSLGEIGRQFREVVRPYFLNVTSEESRKALSEVCKLCRKGNLDEMQEFNFNNFNLDQDGVGVLRSLLQHCVEVFSRKADDQTECMHELNSYYNPQSGFDYGIDDIWN